MAFFLLCEITDTVTPWSSKMFVFSRPLIISKKRESGVFKIWIAGLRVEGSPNRKRKQTNKEANTQSDKKKLIIIAKDTYTCGQELTQINASEKENKYKGSKEKYSP